MATTKKRATATASRKRSTATARKTAMIVDEGAKGGFTIIEVVLVLAIAGLIFLMVFLAFPALRRSQQDTQRRQTLSALKTAVMRYQDNNNGRLPCGSTSCTTPAVEGGADKTLAELYTSTSSNQAQSFIVNYMNGADSTYSEFVDPTGYAMGLTIETLADSKTLNNTDYKNHMAYVFRGARCDGETAVKSTNSRDFVVMYKLEGGGTYCE